MAGSILPARPSLQRDTITGDITKPLRMLRALLEGLPLPQKQASLLSSFFYVPFSMQSPGLQRAAQGGVTQKLKKIQSLKQRDSLSDAGVVQPDMWGKSGGVKMAIHVRGPTDKYNSGFDWS